MDVLAELNPAQRAAVEAIGGPVLILAGPGSGKTRVIAHRVAYLIRVCGVSPYRIMAVTFTNKAAREMQERLNKLVSFSARDLTIGTFHAICARILRRDGQAMDIAPRFVIYDEDDQLTLLKRSLEDVGLDPKQYAPRAIASAISAAKSHMLTPQGYLQSGRSYFEEVAGRVYERYQQLLQQNNALDFDDLLMQAVLLFRNHADVLSRYQERYLHVLVDEFQDTNLTQYELVRQLGGRYRNVCVVGDPDQSIYSWRFADPRNIASFERDYPDAKVVLLEQNYRSTQNILEIASSVISASQPRQQKTLWTENEPGELTTVVETYNEQEEAQFVVSEIDRLTRQGDFQLGDFAVMYRTNAQSRALEEAFIRYGVPYRLVAATRFYERREVKDIIAYLRLVQNPGDSVSLRRVINVPGRGIGPQTQARLAAWARSENVSEYEALKATTGEGQTVFAPQAARALAAFIAMLDEFITASHNLDMVGLFDLVVERSGYRQYVQTAEDGEERWENVLELRTVAQQYRDLEAGEGLTAFLEGVTLVADVDSLNGENAAATLITLHQAKGLEFPVVFIVGMEEGVLPHIRSFDDPAQMEEERRLCYVGVTRAERRLYLVRAFRRSRMGTNSVNQPSRFLDDIPRHLVVVGGMLAEGSPASKPIYAWEGTDAPVYVGGELKAGERVRHNAFGEGVVVSYRQMDNDAEAVVVFDGVGIKKLLLSFARLEKVE